MTIRRGSDALALVLAAAAALPSRVLAASDRPHADADAATASDARPLAAKFPEDAILGRWVTPAEENRPPGRFKFVKAPDGTFMGILEWSSESRKDVHNKDPQKRERPLVGLVLVWHLTYDDGEYVDGYVYNPEDGGTYRVKAELESPETLKIRGYVGIALLGQSTIWARYHA